MMLSAAQNKFSLLVILIITGFYSFAQISPGDLTQSHAHLEGLSNCTKCHVLGEQVSNDKCLDCHKEIKVRINEQKGYHSSPEIKGKECVKCHSDHHGKNFEMIRFDIEKFDHSLTGYKLAGVHATKDCKDCHKTSFISDQKIKKKKFTYLGLKTNCLTCHTDYHQKSLDNDCALCHDFEAFKPASLFDHGKSKFQLLGKHKQTDCIKCHKKEIINGQDFQQFSGVKFDNCTRCHEDIHKNKFGQNCIKCHSRNSFQQIIGVNTFNHNLTNYKLENKHQFVDCKLCHKTKYTDPVKYDRCTDCHTDYHNEQFVTQGIAPDCSDCHTTKGFSGSLFTIEHHNAGNFKLEGAHLAIPCFTCHKKEEKWNFREIGKRCVDCHENIHKPYLDKKYYPEASCKSCHSNNRWGDIEFDHSLTSFKLEGAHTRQTCSSCHLVKNPDGPSYQQFSGLPANCMNCHNDVHYNQFEEDGVTNCRRCHDFNNWVPAKFNHNNARFKLDGKHQTVTCNECHKQTIAGQIKYVQYKFKDISCESCH